MRETGRICEQAKGGNFIEKRVSKLELLAYLLPWRPTSLTVTSAHCFVVMVSSRGTWDHRGLAQRVARLFLADLCMGEHFPPTLLLQRGRGGLLYPLIQGWWELSSGIALNSSFMKLKLETCSWASFFTAFLGLGNLWKAQERKTNYCQPMNSIKTTWR